MNLHSSITPTATITFLGLNFILLVVCSNFHEIHSQNVSLAYDQSFGFFKDISNEHWIKKKSIHCSESAEGLQEGQVGYLSKMANHYYNRKKWAHIIHTVYDPTFTCPFERKFGSRGDGGKWICDPHRIDRNKCLVYSFGSNNQFDFEETILSKLGCEIHTFDFTASGEGRPSAVSFHRWGLTDGTSVAKSVFASSNAAENGEMKNMTQIISALSHKNRTIDILKIDIDGNEYKVLTPNFFASLSESSVLLRQILIEVHPPADTNPIWEISATEQQVQRLYDLFRVMFLAGFVVFHKELNGYAPGAAEFALLKLDGGFHDCMNIKQL